MQTKKRRNPSRIRKMYNKTQNLFLKIHLLQDRLEQLKKGRVYCKVDLSKLQKCEIFQKMN